MSWWPFAPTGGGSNTVTCVVKNTDETTSSTSIQDDDELSIAVGANELWLFFFYIHYVTSSTNDMAINMSIPASAAGIIGFYNVGTDSSGNSIPNYTTAGGVDLAADTDTGGAVQCFVAGVDTAGSSGNVKFRFRTVISNSVTVKAGSGMYGVKIG